MIKTNQPMDFNTVKYSKFADHLKGGQTGQIADAETAVDAEYFTYGTSREGRKGHQSF